RGRDSTAPATLLRRRRRPPSRHPEASRSAHCLHRQARSWSPLPRAAHMPNFAIYRQSWQYIAIVAEISGPPIWRATLSAPEKASSTVDPTAAAVPARARVAWLIWTVGVAAYILTVMQRTTLAAAGLDAADRFGLSPGTLAAFVFIQVAVFSVAQIPAGLMVDRFGPRAMLVANAVLLAGGQILLAHATTMPVAAAARVLVGTGDAVVFAATLALIPRWFSPRRVPLMTQLTTIVGQLGQILSAVPFVALLR